MNNRCGSWVLLVAATTALLGACVAVPRHADAYHTRVIETWVGKDSAKLWESWGPPVRQMTAPNGVEYHIYTQRLGKPAGVVNGELDLRYATASDPDCVTYFAVDPKTHRIQLARWRGTSCALHEPQALRLIPRSIQPTGF